MNKKKRCPPNWEELVDKYEKTKHKLTQQQFAHQQGIELTTFKNRLYRIRLQRSTQETFTQETFTHETSEFVELLVSSPSIKQHVELSIVCDGRVKINCATNLSLDDLSSLLSALVHHKC